MAASFESMTAGRGGHLGAVGLLDFFSGRRYNLPMLTGLVVFTLLAAGGEVVDHSPTHFIIRSSFRVSAPAEKAYEALVEDVAQWWHPDHTWSGDPENLSIAAQAGGCFCEKLEDGGSVKHMEVVYVERRKMLRMSGGLGPLQELPVAGVMIFSFDEDELGTEINLEYKVSGHYEDGLHSLAPAVDQVLTLQLSRLGAFIEGN